MAIFGSKPWVNPFRKMSIFRLFELLFFIKQKGVFSFQNIIKNFFLEYIVKKKSSKKWPFLDKKHRLAPWEKCQFLDVFNFLFLQPRKAFFRSRMSEKTFSLFILLKKKKAGKIAIFGPKPWVNPFGKILIFRLIELLLFIAQKRVFSFYNIIKDIFLAFIA